MAVCSGTSHDRRSLTKVLDTTFLLTFTSSDTGLTEYQRNLSQLNVLVDPWIEGPSTIFHRMLAYSKRTRPACIRHISEIRPQPQIILISQDKPDHCHEQTLKQLPPDLRGTVIIAQANAAKRIRGWKYFDESKIWSFSSYSPSRPDTIYDLRLPLDPDARTLVQPGQITLAFMPAKFDIAGVHNAIGITYRAPVFTNSDETKIGLGVALSPLTSRFPQSFVDRQPGPTLLPTPPDSPEAMPYSCGDPPYSPQLPFRQQPEYGNGPPSPPLTSYQPPPIPDEPEFKGLKKRTKSSSSMKGLYDRASRIITKSTPNLRDRARSKHKPSKSTSSQAPAREHADSLSIASPPNPYNAYNPSPASLAFPPSQVVSPNLDTHHFIDQALPLTPVTPTHSHSGSRWRNDSFPTSPMTISSPLPRPQTAGAPSGNHSRAISVLYSPHGVFWPTIKPWAQHHLIAQSALPLTLLLHPLTHIQNLWILGGNIATGWRGGLEIARNLMAKCWIPAHDEEKVDSGILVKTVKRVVVGRDALERGLGGWDSSYQKRKVATEIMELGVGEEVVLPLSPKGVAF